MYKACVFDMDGTVLNTLDSIAYFGNEALKTMGFSAIPVNEYKRMIGNGADLLIARMLEYGGNPADARSELRREYDRLYEAEPLRLVEIYPGIDSLLRDLKADGVLLGILSNKPDNVTKGIAEQVFPGIFDRVQGQRQEMPQKPDPTALLSMLKEFSVAAENSLYCGDSGVDMETGKGAGLYTVGVCWGFRNRDELIKSGADCLVHSAQELRTAIYGQK